MNGHLTLSKFDSAGDVLWNLEITDLSCSGRAMTLTPDGGCPRIIAPHQAVNCFPHPGGDTPEIE